MYNNKIMKSRRRQLRNKPTGAEEMLWRELRKSQLGFRFTRQYSVVGYVMDFFCPIKRLGIEVDGSVHNKVDVGIYDEYRTRWLEGADIRIIRFRNEEISNNLENVIKVIGKYLDEQPPLKVRGGRGVLC